MGKELAERTDGFSLIEVLVFITILSLFFVTAAAVIVTSLRNIKYNENKIMATRYAEELMEWIKSEKEIDWGGVLYSAPTADNFTEHVTICGNSGGTGCSFCFDSGLSSWPGSGECGITNYDLDSKFKRQVLFTWTTESNYINQVKVDVSVEWQDGGNVHQVPLSFVMNVWE
jgi:type II secretory pathway pseudopilin PulG